MTRSDVAPVYEFGPFRLDPSERLLLRDGQPMALKPKAFDLLVFLVERHGRLVPKHELMEGLWPGTFVEEANLTYTVSILRKALGDQEGDQFVQTVPTRGYRFVASVHQENGTDSRSREGPVNWARRPTRVFLASTVAIALLLVAAGIGWRSRGSRPSNPPEYVLTRLTTDVGLTAFPTISRDGTLVAYASDRGGVGDLDIWVQQVGSGSALRLTDDAADDYEPSLSPDGTRIAFRSNRSGGGIYVMSVFGGEPKLVAPEGRRPRFSPDGKWIAYWVGFEHLLGDTYVVSADGGPPRRIGLGNEEKKHPFEWSGTRAPVWSPDGRRLLVSTWTDWWVVPVGEGIAVQTGALDLIRASGLRLPEDISFAFVPEQWSSDEGDAIIFSAISGDSRNLWKIGIEADTWRAIGPPTRFTFGTEAEQQVSLSDNRRMVFASLTRTSNIWSLPLDANHARVTSEPRVITQEARQLTRPDVSRDGRILVYQDEKHQSDIRVRNLETGKEIGGFSSAEEENYPVVSADGSTVFYTGPPDRIYAVSTGGGLPRLICEKCGALREPFALSPDGGRLAHIAPDAVMEFELRTGRRKRITSRTHHIPESQTEIGVAEMRYSPDGRWLAFHALDGVRRHIFLLDSQATGSGDAQWVDATTEPSNADGRVAWSPDGNLLYFVSERDAFRCIWAQRLDPTTKRPVDPPSAVYHLHQTARRLSHIVGRVGMAVDRDKIVFALEEMRGNVWMRDLASRQ
jgi:DNA-binding winged helix-turn-helix (wHTH) protein/Tol biopolymer transport system component